MPLDPEKMAECRAWLNRASADLDSARILPEADPPRADTALLHCQQAVEKSWKAFLFWHDVSFRKTRNLRALGQAATAVDASVAEDLTQFAWVFRYLGESETADLQEAGEALATARAVHEAILARLPADTRP